MRLRIQVRSYDAMCQMIAVNLGIGILPLQACAPQIKALDLKVARLEDSWAKRNLLLATKEYGRQSPACTLLIEHLLQQRAT
jgi:DNA-binding transcriptional LysR family regulator